MEPTGDVIVRPNRLPFASRLALVGLRIRARTLDIRMHGDYYEVRSNGRTTRARIGELVRIGNDGAPPSPKD